MLKWMKGSKRRSSSVGLLKVRKGSLNQAVRTTVESLERRTLMASIAVDLSSPEQTIKGIGGTYTQSAFRDYAQDAVGQFNLDTLDPRYVRVAIPINQWEPINDNADPNVTNSLGFKDSGRVNETFKLIKQFKDQGRVVTASVFFAPDWMVSNPGTGTNGRLIKDQAEFVESINAFVQRAKDVYGAQIDFLSVNEADGGYTIKLTAQENADIIEASGQKLVAAGLGNTKWIVGETYHIADGTYNYIKSILDDAGAKPYTGPISIHSWWSEDLPRSEWSKFRTLADQYGKDLWNGEMNYYALANQNPGVFTTWDNGLRVAKITAKTLTWMHTNVAMYWQYQDDFPLVKADLTSKYYSYHVVKSFVDNFKPGSQIVKSTTDNSKIYSVAGRDAARNHFAEVAINDNLSDQIVTFSGLPNKPLSLTLNADQNKSKLQGTFTPVNGQLTLTLKAKSMYTLAGELGAVTPDPEPPPAPPPGLPAGWTSKDIGNFGVAGSASESGGMWTVKGAGNDIGGAGDDFHYAYRSLVGDGQIVVRLNDMTNTNISAKAGVMIRETVSGGSKQASLVITPGSGMYVLTRKSTGSATGAAMVSGGQLPRWLKISRQGNVFKYSASADGATYTQLASSTFTMGSNVTIGMAVTSRDVTRLNTATFDNVSVSAVNVPTPIPTPTPTPGTIVANEDTFVRSGAFAGTNYGNDLQLHVKNGASADSDREIYLKFNISSLSAGLASAKLRLFGRLNDTSNANVATTVYKSATDTWSEATQTWNTRAASSATALASATVTDITPRWYEWDLTTFLKKERTNGENTLTLVLKNSALTSAYTWFNSSEAASNQPQLVVT